MGYVGATVGGSSILWEKVDLLGDRGCQKFGNRKKRFGGWARKPGFTHNLNRRICDRLQCNARVRKQATE